MERLPGPPPMISGFHYIGPLGAGGFADVYLYEQDMPRRKVAVKVLHGDVVDNELLGMFAREADAMAALSSHPSILTIHQASVSADGRPYLVLEYCQDSLGQRYRYEKIPVAEVVRLGVRIGSALETCHRAGILHRDIKPSNLLVNQFGTPVLSDFGIVGGYRSKAGERIALSVPWSAPEVVNGETAGSVATEVWSLGATLYALLAGHGPFEVAGEGQNSISSIKKRIRKARYTPISRSDVPPVLQDVLAKAMAQDPNERYQSLEEFAEDLRAVEYQMGLAPTDLQIAAAPNPALSAPTNGSQPPRTPVRSYVPVDSKRSRRQPLTDGSSHSRASASVTNTTGSDHAASKKQMALIVAGTVVITAVVVVFLMMWLG